MRKLAYLLLLIPSLVTSQVDHLDRLYVDEFIAIDSIVPINSGSDVLFLDHDTTRGNIADFQEYLNLIIPDADTALFSYDSDTANFATLSDSARAAATAEGSQGNFTASGDITGDNLISLGGITATFEVEAGTVRALDSVVTTQLNMNGDEANGIAGSSQIDVLFHSVSFIDTTEVWGYKKVFMTNSGKMYAMIEPHVFLFNPVSQSGVTQSVGTAWEKFSPGDSAFFEFAGRQNIDSIGNDTIGMVFSGHLWVDGSIGIAGSTGRTIDIRMYNVTKDEIVKSGGSVTTQGAGNRMDLNLKGYCINCHAGDKIIIQVRTDQVTTFTFYRGEIRLDGNHGFE